jgi:hypothetical protein
LSDKSCVFLAHGLGYISPFPYTTWSKARYQKIPKTFTYYFCTISNLWKFDFPLPRDQTSRSRIWQMINENSSVGLSRLLWTISDICKVSGGTRVVRICSTNFFYTLLCVKFCMEMEKCTPNRARFFSAQEIYNLKHWTKRSYPVCQQNIPGKLRFRSYLDSCRGVFSLYKAEISDNVFLWLTLTTFKSLLSDLSLLCLLLSHFWFPCTSSD